MRRLLVLAGLLPVAGWAGDSVRDLYRGTRAVQMVPLLTQAIRFATVEGDAEAHSKQRQWLRRVAGELGFAFRDAGTVAEIELAGPPGAPVLGLVVHGDVQAPGEHWSVPPFAGVAKDGYVYGRGAADDKGPLVQALLAMATLRDSGRPLTHTIRLLVGSDEESSSADMPAYLKKNRPPDLSLVLDSQFPVVVGEKAWDEFTVTAADPFTVRPGGAAPWALVALEAGTATSIVPDRATAVLRWLRPAPPEPPAGSVPEGFRLEAALRGREWHVTVRGRAAHAGMNIERGRNALVAVAGLIGGDVAPCAARDLLEFAAEAGRDLHGTGLGLTGSDPLWGRYAVNVATLKPAGAGALRLAINLRRTPPMSGAELRARLEGRLAAFNRAHGATLAPGGYFDEKPLVFDPEARLVKRLISAYERVTGERPRPAIAGGGTYAGRMPNSIAFGMWFPGQPYPGHDADERIAVADLHRGVDVLLEALADMACSPPLRDPFRR